MIIVGHYFMNLSPIFQDIILFSTSILKMLSREYRMIGSQKNGVKVFVQSLLVFFASN
jgi:hypothetical protein